MPLISFVKILLSNKGHRMTVFHYKTSSWFIKIKALTLSGNIHLVVTTYRMIILICVIVKSKYVGYHSLLCLGQTNWYAITYCLFVSLFVSSLSDIVWLSFMLQSDRQYVETNNKVLVQSDCWYVCFRGTIRQNTLWRRIWSNRYRN